MSDPTVSVVIAWVNPLELLQPGIDSLDQQECSPEEIIVVTRHDTATQGNFRSLYPGVKLLSAPARTTIPALRSLGMRHAKGSMIAVTEDHCVPARDWIARIVTSARNGRAVTGGPVENACTRRMRDWAAFLTEYAGVVRPGVEGVSNGLPGNNVAYRAELVPGLCETLDLGQWESFYHQTLVEKEVAMVFDRDLIVYHRRPFDFWYFVRLRYHFCRSFAGMRLPMLKGMARWKYALGCVALPPVLFLRSLRNLIARKRLVGRYLACSPLIALYFAVGAAGEMTGYLFGGGKSLEKVE
jgi:glycosyltransferase involved in cell wall biosynthesis